MEELKNKIDEILKYTILSSKKMLTVQEVSLLTGFEVSYIYKLTSQKEIPYYKPNGKTIFFNKKEVEKWLQKGKVLSNEEIFETVNKPR